MAYGTTTYVGVTPKKMAATIKSVQMTRSKCLRQIRAVNNHWTGLLEWTTGLTIFVTYNEIPLPVKLHPALDQSVIVSTITLHRTTHFS